MRGMIEILATIPRLPEAPLVERLLFESPWPLAGMAVVIGVIAAVMLNRRGRGAAALGAGVGGLALAAALVVMAGAVVTDREEIGRRSSAFVEAVAAGDAMAAEELLLEDVSLRVGEEAPAGNWRAAILGAVQTAHREYGIEAASMGNVQTSATEGGFGRSVFRVTARASAGFPSVSWWKLDWRRDHDEKWRIEVMRCLEINGREPGAWLTEQIRALGRG